MKDTYYFQHDYNARKDPKCSALINDFGLAGYGIYWCLIEILHEQGGKIKKFPKLIDGIAFELGIEIEALTKQIEAMLQDYNLLQEDENYIWSNRVLKNLEDRENKKQLKINAGRLGGLKSGEIRKKQNQERSKTKQCLKQNEANEAKESKVKQSKVNSNKLINNNELSDNIINNNINKLFDIFYKINPTLKFGIKTYRTAAENLYKKFGEEKTIRMAEYACSIIGKEYAPVITNPYELEKNVSKLSAYYQRNNKITSNITLEDIK